MAKLLCFFCGMICGHCYCAGAKPNAKPWPVWRGGGRGARPEGGGPGRIKERELKNSEVSGRM